MLCEFVLKMPVHAAFGKFWGQIQENGNFLQIYPSRNAIIGMVSYESKV